MKLREKLRSGFVFYDGGTGTLLQQRGLRPGELPELWNLTHPEEITALHFEYLEAGCNIINTNTFGASRLGFLDLPGTPSLEVILRAAVKNAKEAVRRANETLPAADRYVALDIGPTGKLLKPLGDLEFEEAVRVFSEMVHIGAAAGADLITIETMNSGIEAKAALLAAKECSDLPVIVTMVFDESYKLLTGADPTAVTVMLEGLGADAVGMNCGLGPIQMKPIVPELVAAASVPVAVVPNAGLPHIEDGRTVFDVGPEAFASVMAEIAAMGARVLGGCCGTTPEHIRSMIERVRDMEPVPVRTQARTVVSSADHAVVIGDTPVLIGERINPTGRKWLKEALRTGDYARILREGVKQAEEGADVLDVNLGLPGTDELAAMAEVIPGLQSVTDLPLQIDSSNPAAMEAALRIYNGKAILNSVNGTERSMASVLPLVKKYGCAVIALALDEKGIPETPEGRLAVIRRIADRAESLGIGRQNILADMLTLAVGTDSAAPETTLRSVELVKGELGIRTVLGVSNVSFGLPRREIISAAFFSMALALGLDAAIVNTGSEEMQKVYRSFLALTGRDRACEGYIAFASEAPIAPAAAVPADPSEALKRAVIHGLQEDAGKLTRALLEQRPPLEIVDGVLIPALDEVGRDYETGKSFLPQLLMSANAAKEAFAAIRAKMADSGAEQEKKAKIVFATVSGDIHDIGKNIVCALMENYGYEVIDLGRDVAPEAVAEAVRREKAELCGLSALMTTTVPAMEETIRLLRIQTPWCRIMVGGAVLTKEYAEKIGADAYGKDAMDSVRKADELLKTRRKQM